MSTLTREAPAAVAAERPVPAAVWRARHAAVCAALTALAFMQAPGLVVADTKLDLTVAPARLLGRALHLWDPLGYFGQLQNQGYGYLWPMGPFFALGRLVGLPPWVVQRLWWSVLLVVAYLGAVRVAAALRIGTPWTRLLAAAAYAVSPRMMSVLGPISAEALPLAVAPWVLLPLVVPSAGRSPRRAAAWSGVAFLCAGGVNAVATAAVLPPAALWVLTRRPPLRRRLAGWWALTIGLASVWWLLPLMVLGRYSPPFLDWIEPASVTTAITSLVETIRGTSHWLAYLGTFTGPTWPGGWHLVTSATAIVATVALAGLGLAGLARRDVPHRTYLVVTLVAGLVLVTMGHVGPLSGAGAGTLRRALDAGLAPLRNVHKFDLVVRLPLVLGLAHALARVRLPGLRPRDVRLAAVAAAALAVVVAASPALDEQLPQPGAHAGIPGYWRQTAQWLDAHSGGQRALVVPAASFGTYLWGRSQDEPLQPLARTPWAVRDAVPLSSAGNIRFLDELERRLDTGAASPGLAEYLSTAGVGFVVVRNDLDRSALNGTRPLLVHQALEQSPGIVRVAEFGPAVGSVRDDSGRFVDAGLDVPYPAVEVYRVASGSAPVVTLPGDDALRVVGGPEAVASLTDAGLAPGQAVLLAGDPHAVPAGDESLVLTDTDRRREVAFGRVRDNRSVTMTADEAFRQPRPVHDYVAIDDPALTAVARLEGARSIEASSSASDVTGVGTPSLAQSPWQAFDGDGDTAWVSGAAAGAVGQWLELRLLSPVDVGSIEVTFASGPLLAQVTRVRLTTDEGSRETAVEPGQRAQRLATAPGLTRRVRITVTGVKAAGRGLRVGVADVSVPGVVVRRPVALAAAPGDPGAPAAIALRAPVGGIAACARSGERVVCAPELARTGEEDNALDRVVTMPAAATYDVDGDVAVRPGATRLLDPLPGQLAATVSSSQTGSPIDHGIAVVDADPGTTWIAGPGDRTPTIELQWGTPRRVGGFRLRLADDTAAARPTEVRVQAPGLDVIRAVGADGTVSFPPVSTDRLRVRVTDTGLIGDVSTTTGLVRRLPVGISELELPGVDDLKVHRTSADPTGVPCGFGPPLHVDGTVVPTRVEGTVGEVTGEQPLHLVACAPVRLTAGEHRLTIGSTLEFRPTTLTLRDPQRVPTGATDGAVDVVRWGATDRTVRLPLSTSPRYLVVRENWNAGWRASAGGRVLRPTRLAGWQQGWVVPAGTGGLVHLTFTPDTGYRAGLAAGLVAALALVVLAVWPPRRHDDGPPVAVAPSVGTRRLALVLAVAGMLALGGWAGLGAVLAAGLVHLLGRRMRADLLPWLGGLAYAAAGLVLATHHWNGTGSYAGGWALVQALCLLAVAALVVGLALAGRAAADVGDEPAQPQRRTL